MDKSETWTWLCGVCFVQRQRFMSCQTALDCCLAFRLPHKCVHFCIVHCRFLATFLKHFAQLGDWAWLGMKEVHRRECLCIFADWLCRIICLYWTCMHIRKPQCGILFFYYSSSHAGLSRWKIIHAALRSDINTTTGIAFFCFRFYLDHPVRLRKSFQLWNTWNIQGL